jgi:6-phosphofructokinase 1
VLIPEQPTAVEEITKVIEGAYQRGKTHAIIVVAEGFRPSTSELGKMIDELDLGFTTRVTILGHIQRGGKPSAFDRLLATRFGVKAVEFLLAGQSGVMVGLNGREMQPIPIETVVSQPKKLSKDYYEMAAMLAK